MIRIAQSAVAAALSDALLQTTAERPRRVLKLAWIFRHGQISEPHRGYTRRAYASRGNHCPPLGVGRDRVQGDLRGRLIDVPRLQSQGRPIR